MTNGLPSRIEQHRAGVGSAFTRKYRVHMLVWYEKLATCEAIQREKIIEHYVRAWKVNLIERANPHWIDSTRRCLVLHLFRCSSPAESWALGTSPRVTLECGVAQSYGGLG